MDSRHGEPSWDTSANSSTQAPPPRWAKSVEWAKADLLEPGSYSHFLKDASAVVHTMGILLEADYKSIVRGKESPITGLQKIFGCQHKTAAEQKAALDNKQVTYGTMNRDSGEFGFLCFLVPKMLWMVMLIDFLDKLLC